MDVGFTSLSLSLCVCLRGSVSLVGWGIFSLVFSLAGESSRDYEQSDAAL
jgi:hypothetical protein